VQPLIVLHQLTQSEILVCNSLFEVIVVVDLGLIDLAIRTYIDLNFEFKELLGGPLKSLFVVFHHLLPQVTFGLEPRHIAT
jgi:hypothetical protein